MYSNSKIIPDLLCLYKNNLNAFKYLRALSTYFGGAQIFFTMFKSMCYFVAYMGKMNLLFIKLFECVQKYLNAFKIDHLLVRNNFLCVQIRKNQVSTYWVEVHAKICIKYRKHWKSYMSSQLSGQIGLIWAVLKLPSKS